MKWNATMDSARAEDKRSINRTQTFLQRRTRSVFAANFLPSSQRGLRFESFLTLRDMEIFNVH